MNWYTNIKSAMPLPEAEDYPSPYGDKKYTDYAVIPDLPELRHNKNTIKNLDLSLKNTDLFAEYQPLQYLGAGTRGVAYYSPLKNVVIKATFDDDELYDAKKIMELQKNKNNSKHVVKIYSAEEVSVEDRENDSYNIAIIVMEKVNELTDMEKRIVWVIYQFIWEENNPISRTTNRTKMNLKIWNNWKIKEYGDRPTVLEFNNVSNKTYDMMIFLQEKMGMNLSDLHHDNIGKRDNGDYVLLDVGGSFE